MLRKIRRLLRRSSKNDELEYENIVMDSMNLPEFDRSQMEGILERSIAREAFVALIIVLILILIIFVFRLGYLQIAQGAYYRDVSQNNRLASEVIFNKRGIVYDRNKLELAWNEFSEEKDFSLRRYYQNPGLAHLLGYVSYPGKDSAGNYFSTEYKGISGIEYAYNGRLNGTSGRRIREVNALGETVSSYAIREPVPGENVYLSIDSNIQSKLYEMLEEYIQSQGFVGGAGVIMNVRNGHIIAMTSVPEYDSNILADGNDRAQIAEYNTNTRLPFLNRVTGGSFAPGSIIKVFIASGILDKDLVDPHYKLFTNGILKVANKYGGGYTIFRDARNNGSVNMYDAIALSSNIYFMTFGGGYAPHTGLGIKGMVDYLSRFGFGEETGIAEFNELSGNVPSPEWKKQTFGEAWLLGDTYYTAIGQYSFLATPLQAVVATAAIANGGDVLVPKLELTEPRELRRNIQISEKDLQVVRDAMRQTVLRGTTQSLNLPFVEVASKSGTAERGVSRNEVNSWAIGFWPYKDPQYAFVVMTERGPPGYRFSVSRVMTNLLRWMNEQEMDQYFPVHN
ncbi:MAG: penicillin-binding transpeptidase domain-containing protein [Patescibacteria group bacterium]